ncbi:hypothetical protein [Sphingomonas sp. NFX23]|uniref:nucleoside triphosphate pyrophosphohydrolase family protein n=1 Tax=Sphingomonas sp. NFX23 TaxID=2819532 RepID=UPI003CF04160
MLADIVPDSNRRIDDARSAALDSFEVKRFATSTRARKPSTADRVSRVVDGLTSRCRASRCSSLGSNGRPSRETAPNPRRLRFPLLRKLIASCSSDLAPFSRRVQSDADECRYERPDTGMVEEDRVFGPMSRNGGNQEVALEFNEYQDRAAGTVKMDLGKSDGRMELVFGLMSEVGSLAQAFKLYLRDAVGLEMQRSRLIEDIGDVQWYLAMIARSLDIDLEDVVRENLNRVTDRYGSLQAGDPAQVTNFDEGYTQTEVFPRRMLFRIAASDGPEGDPSPHVSFYVMAAAPYAFEAFGDEDGKQVGFRLGQSIGDPVNDNSSTDDGYRFHDAVHVAFMAVLGWSPVMRHLLRVKRKSNLVVDRTQDGARARDLEEALSAILKAFSTGRNHYASDKDVDGEVRDFIRRVVSDLEVASAPIWLWARAITQGYSAMNALREKGDGWLVADLDLRSVSFHPERPDF